MYNNDLATLIKIDTITGTTDNYGRLLINSGTYGSHKIILFAWIENTSYIVAPYRYASSGGANVIVFKVITSEADIYDVRKNQNFTITFAYIEY